MGNIKKIVYFLDIPDFLGGANKVLLTQACILKQRGYQIRVIIPEQAKDYHTAECVEICSRNGLELLSACFKVSACMESIDILQALKDYQDIVKILCEDKPDMIHSVQLNIAVELAARELGIPHLMNIYQVDRESFHVDWMKIYPQYHCADSIWASRRWGEGLGIPSRCIRVAYESNECNKIFRDRKSGTVTILSIGVLCERKNQLDIIKFVLKCRNSGKRVRLIVLGDYENAYGTQCRDFVDRNGLQDSVVFKGFVLNIEQYFKEADVFVLASCVESYPGVIVESMANRVPVISTPVAGVPELLVDESNGFLTAGYGAEYIYEAFLRYLSFREKGFIAPIVENAYITYLQNHTYKSVGNQLEDYYRWIVEDYENRKAFFLTADVIMERFREVLIEKKMAGFRIEDHCFIWLLSHIFSIIGQKENKKIAIWGAGYWGSQVLEWICVWEKELEVIGFIDTYKEGEYLGYPIIKNKEMAITECGTILVALVNIRGMLEIMQCLESCGKIRNKDYFLIFNSPIRI